MYFATATVVTGLLLRPVVATFGHGGWGGDSHYSTPDNTDNKCSSEQAKGYDWTDLASGSFDSYGSNQFSKWSCTNSFGKRDLLTKRTFQSKCISSNLDDEPSIGCNGDDSMSIDKYEVSSSEDADIECHYEMPDKTVCKEYHSCKSGGTVIQNTQCGGAKSVTFKPAKSYQGKGCNIGVHSIGFNCGTASSTVPAYSKTESIPAYGSSTPTNYATSSAEISTETMSTSSAVEITTDTTPYTSPASTVSATSDVPSYGSSTESVPSYGSITTSSSAAPTESIPSYDTTSSITTAPEASTTPSVSSGTAPVETTPQSAPSYETSTCVEGYGSSCSSTVASSSVSSATSRETSPVEPSASESSTASLSTYVTTTSAAPSVPTYPIYNTSTSATAPSSNTSLTYSLPAYSQSSSTIVETTTAGSISSYTTSTIYSTSCETLTSSGGVTTLTKSYAVSTTVAPVTSPGKESSPVETGGSATSSATSSTTSYSGPEPSSPALLPRCLNTWMYLTECTSNSDSDCYCEKSDFINKVYGCLSSWSQSADNATNGVSYLMGLCAPYIEKNPAIITGCPSTITPAAYTPPAQSTAPASTSTITLQFTITNSAPVPSSTEVSPTTPPAIPCTTITYSSQITIPATYPTGSSQGYTIPSSSIISAIVTTITVPRVIIQTQTITESGNIITTPALGYGAPPPPTSTAAAGISSTLAAPVTTSWAATAPGYASVGFGTSARASSSLPSGVVPYEGAGVKNLVANFFWIGGCGLVAGMVLL